MKRIEKIHDVHEVAERLGLSHWTVRTLIAERRIGYYRLGSPTHGALRIAESDLQEYLERARVEAFGVRVDPLPERARKPKTVGLDIDFDEFPES
jgi:excisionase family DNA binding protein